MMEVCVRTAPTDSRGDPQPDAHIGSMQCHFCTKGNSCSGTCIADHFLNGRGRRGNNIDLLGGRWEREAKCSDVDLFDELLDYTCVVRPNSHIVLLFSAFAIRATQQIVQTNH